ncbi:MAG: hypothetical protein HUK21_09970 [Fibrobacteraceae bacterium]|nr:hypothetical protein [Fibrobacteraceae bacterium]
MRRLVLIFLLTIVLLAEAATHCESLDQYVNLGYDVENVKNAVLANLEQDFRQQCVQATGSSDIFFYSGEWVKTCEGQSGSKTGYIKSVVRCDFCDGANIQLQLQMEESFCNAECKKKNATCMRMASGWGGEIVKINPNGGDCGAFDPTLPNCSESSSSEIERSSSSEKQSSSSLTSSSSIMESSSSEEFLESSSSEKIDSSSSEEKDGSSSSEESCGEGGDHCGGSSDSGGGAYCQIDDDNWETLSRLPNIHRDIYYVAPYMINRDNAYLQNCYCTGTRAVACDFANFGLVQGYEPVSMPLCGLREGYWCKGIPEGFCDYTGVTTRIYYSDSPEAVGFSWGAANFDNSGNVLPIETEWQTVFLNHNGIISHQFSIRHLLPTNILYYDLEDIVREALPDFPDMDKLVAYCMGEWIPHDDDCFGTEIEAGAVQQDSSDRCAISFGIPHYATELSNRGWCVVGECEAAEPYSSAEESSSSFTQSSCSVEESSSSVVESSSSITDESSSSSTKTEPFVAGENQVYTPDQIFNSGLQNMEQGKCYSLNPDRGVISGWNIGYNAEDPWWWREVDCATGEKPIEKGIGICAAFPGTKPTKTSSCYAYNGSCYKCDDSRDYVDCNADWLWKYNFPYHDWFKQVDCYESFENDDNLNAITGKCMDEGMLMKKAYNTYQLVDTESSYSVDYLPPVKKFDVLGRCGAYKYASNVALYQKRSPVPKIDTEFDNSFVPKSIKVNSKDYCYRDSFGKWICNISKKTLEKRVYSLSEFVDQSRCDIKKGHDYWYYVKDGESTTYVGGVTCAWPAVELVFEKISHKNNLVYSYGKEVGAKASVTYRVTSHTTLGENNHIIMKAGDTFSDGHIVSAQEENTYEKHEQGHEFYNGCIKFVEMNIKKTFECTVEFSKQMSDIDKTSFINNMVDEEFNTIHDNDINVYLEDALNKAQKKIDQFGDLFHANFGLGGFSDKGYTCPQI